jgi:hypothetical protein
MPSVVVAYVATPAASVPVPSVAAPSLKVTVPVGAVVPEAGVTVAVNVMLVPKTALVDDAPMLVVVPTTGAVIVTVVTAEVDALNPLAPP